MLIPNNGSTALHYAATYGHDEIVKLQFSDIFDDFHHFQTFWSL